MKCWIKQNRDCNEGCPAHLTLETANPKATAIHGMALWASGELLGSDEYAEMRTTCSFVYSIFQIAEYLRLLKNCKEEESDKK